MNLPALGIDIAKDFFDVALRREGKSTHKIFPNTSQGMQQLGEWLAGAGGGPSSWLLRGNRSLWRSCS